MLYLSSGVLLVDSSENQLERFGKRTGDVEVLGNEIL